MSGFKGTPGPWRLLAEECDRPYIRIRGGAIGQRFKIANILTPVYVDVHAREAEETRANAKLIVAAHDLLEACERARSHLYQAGYEPKENSLNPSEGLLFQLNATISKALGE